MWWLRQFVWGLWQVVINHFQIFVSQEDIEIHHLSIIRSDLQGSFLFVYFTVKKLIFLVIPHKAATLNTNHLSTFQVFPSVIFSM